MKWIVTSTFPTCFNLTSCFWFSSLALLFLVNSCLLLSPLGTLVLWIGYLTSHWRPILISILQSLTTLGLVTIVEPSHFDVRSFKRSRGLLWLLGSNSFGDRLLSHELSAIRSWSFWISSHHLFILLLWWKHFKSGSIPDSIESVVCMRVPRWYTGYHTHRNVLSSSDEWVP